MSRHDIGGTVQEVDTLTSHVFSLLVVNFECRRLCRLFQCVVNSRGLPLATINVLRSHSEMSDWVHPLRHDAPFYVSNNNYTKISVDRVEASDGQVHNVLLLATGASCLSRQRSIALFVPSPCHYVSCNHVSAPEPDSVHCYSQNDMIFLKCCLCAIPTESGKIHKVLEVGSEPFIISETRLQSQSNMQSMKLDSRQVRLLHTTSCVVLLSADCVSSCRHESSGDAR